MDPVPDPEQGLRDTLPATVQRIADEVRELTASYMRAWSMLEACQASADSVGIDPEVLDPAREAFGLHSGVVDGYNRRGIDDDAMLELARRLGLDLPPKAWN